MIRIPATALAIGAFLFCAGSSAQPVSSSSGGVAVRQLSQTRNAMRQQRKQTDQLKTRVSGLEKKTADNRRQLAARDQKIADLQRQLDAMTAGRRSAAPAEARSGG